MTHNTCKHDGEFVLSYNMLTHNYAYACRWCQVFKLSFNPQLAGKASKGYYEELPNVWVAEWTAEIIAYHDRTHDATKKYFPPIDYKKGEH